MTWLLAAVAGHLMNAGAFIVDKALLSVAFKRSGTYAFVIGLISSMILVFLPVVSWNLGPDTWVAIAIFGSVFVLALWAFFEALSRAEASRIVPIVGSLIPVFTLLDSVVIINERLPLRILLGLAFLLVATVLLTRGGTKKQRLSASTAGLCVLAAFLFAASSVSGKYAFEHAPFLDAFVLSRVFSIAIALCIPLISSNTRAELARLVRPGAHPTGPKPIHLVLMAAGQASGAVGFVGVQYAISLGSATVVNALQAVQYAAIVLVAWLGGKKLAALLKEDLTRRTLLIKGVAIGLVGIGLVLVGLPTA
ncbi:MAG: DMT family transporter [Patescibacteria group bacterium]